MAFYFKKIEQILFKSIYSKEQFKKLKHLFESHNYHAFIQSLRDTTLFHCGYDTVEEYDEEDLMYIEKELDYATLSFQYAEYKFILYDTRWSLDEFIEYINSDFFTAWATPLWNAKECFESDMVDGGIAIRTDYEKEKEVALLSNGKYSLPSSSFNCCNMNKRNVFWVGHIC